MPQEKNIESSIARYLNGLRNCLHLKIHGTGTQKKLVDRWIVYKGVTFIVETKVPGKDPDPYQSYVLKKARRAGAVAAVVHSAKELRALMEEHTKRKETES